MFARAPVAGAVKTRLVPALGVAAATRLHESLVVHAIATAAAAKPSLLQLWCTPDAHHPFFADCAGRFACELRVQQGGDLGERMAGAFAAASPLIVIGTDCPPLRASHLARAWAALGSHDVVIAPAEDGGYVLIGLAHPVPSLFRGVAWGGAGVMRETRSRVAAAGLACAELDTLWDVDRPEDYRRLESSGIVLEAEAR